MNRNLPKHLHVAALALALAALAALWPGPASARRPANPTGTFSSMYYHPEAGDLLGMEIRMVYSRNGFQGTIQDAQGEPDDLIFFTATMDEDNNVTLTFTEPKTGKPITISGRITEAGFEKETEWWTGGHLLKRAPSYWDERRSSPP